MKQANRFLDVLPAGFVKTGHCPQVIIVPVEALGWFSHRPVDFGVLEFGSNCADDLQRDVVLEIEDVFHRPVEAVGPKMRPCRSVDQLPRHPNPAGDLANASLENVTDAEFAAHPLDVNRLPFIGEARVSRDDEQAVVPR